MNEKYKLVERKIDTGCKHFFAMQQTAFQLIVQSSRLSSVGWSNHPYLMYPLHAAPMDANQWVGSTAMMEGFFVKPSSTPTLKVR